MNKFGEALIGFMDEAGIDGLPELARRMREHPTIDPEDIDEAYLERAMTAHYWDEFPETFYVHSFYALGEVLGLSMEETEWRLILPHSRSTWTPLARPVFARSRQLDPRLGENATLDRAIAVLGEHGEEEKVPPILYERHGGTSLG